MESTGLYLPGNGVLHRWHPLTKGALTIAAGLLAFADLLRLDGIPLLPWLAVAGLFGLALLDGRGTARLLLWRFFLLLLPILISLLFVQGFFYPGADEIILQVGPLSLKEEGVRFGAVILSRLALLLGVILLLVITTHPADLTSALTQIGVPREISYVILAAFQLVPRIQMRAQSITNAQRARGLRTEGNLLVRIRALLPLVGPLILGALHETEERALALEARAFRAPGPKSSWRLLHDSPWQRLARWGLLLGSLLLFVWARFIR